jgi:hypothetical protein
MLSVPQSKFITPSSSVYVDGERISGSVFKARLENALGIPVRQPRIVRLYLDPE